MVGFVFAVSLGVSPLATQTDRAALAKAMTRKGVRLLHLKTDPERISAGTTITALRKG